jgi:hypothetical protein
MNLKSENMVITMRYIFRKSCIVAGILFVINLCISCGCGKQEAKILKIPYLFVNIRLSAYAIASGIIPGSVLMDLG